MPAYEKPPKWMGLDDSFMVEGACSGHDARVDELPEDEQAFLRELFYSDDERGTLGLIRQVEAKRICWVECTVRATCLEYALEAEIDHGIWWATNPTEREELRRARAGAEQLPA